MMNLLLDMENDTLLQKLLKTCRILEILFLVVVVALLPVPSKRRMG